MITTLGSKHRVTISQKFIEILGLNSNSKLSIDLNDKGKLLLHQFQ